MNAPIDWSESPLPPSPMGIEETFTVGQQQARETYLTTPLRRTHLKAILGALIVILLVIEGQIAYLQLIRGGTYWRISELNRAWKVPLEAPRAVLLDRHGTMLVSNVPSFSLSVNRVELELLPNPEEMLVQLSRRIGIDPEELRSAVAAAPQAQNAPTALLLNNEQALFLRVHAQEFPWFSVKTAQTRRYDTTSTTQSLSHILGYIGRPTLDDVERRNISHQSFVGRSGVERSMDERLRGKEGWKAYEVDARGRKGQLRESQEPLQGEDVKLSIDTQLQEAAERALRSALVSSRSKAGSVVALEPTSGEVLAMVSLPSFDNNVFTQPGKLKERAALLTNPARPLFHRAVSGLYPSGSIIKPLIAVIALEENGIDPSTTILSTGGVRIDKWFFPDWKQGGHGATNLKRALAESVNTYFYTIVGGSTAERLRGKLNPLGITKAAEGLKRFGWGQPTGIELPDEASGLLPTPEWKEATRSKSWYIGDTYHFAIGQGDVLASPLQVAQAYGMLANGGLRVRPTLLFQPKRDGLAGDRPFSPLSIDAVKEGLAEAVRTGSARRLNAIPARVWAKTGTAQVGGGRESHSWIAAIAKKNNANLVLVVLVEEGGEGSATTVAQNILTWWGRSQTPPKSG